MARDRVRNRFRNRAVIALGSNLGDPVTNLRAAASRLRAVAGSEMSASSIWKTAPVGFADEVPDFCNAIVVFETELSARELLELLKDIERKMGRLRENTLHYESRLIDLDIIALGGNICDEPGLTLPHPRAHERLFVLLPLQEVLPEYEFPEQSKSLNQLIAEVPVSHLEKFSPLIPSD